MSHPLVVHCKREKYDIYIGRRRGEKFHYGNPFSHKNGTLAGHKVATHDESIRAYEDWLIGQAHHDIEPERRKWILEHLEELRDKKLGCFCAPFPCHGDILVKLAEQEKS